MKLSEKLITIAEWLENSDNELLQSAEDKDECLSVVASALVKAASALKEGAENVSTFENSSELTSEKLDEIAAVAQAFDESGDELLQKQASVLDEILLTIAAPKNAVLNAKKAEEAKIDLLKKKYKEPKEELDEVNKVADALKAIEKAPVYKQYRTLETSLSTRSCPDHPGAQIARVGEDAWQCSLDNKVYNYEVGFTDMQGNKVPGGSVSEQTPATHEIPHTVFDSRESKMYK